MIFDRLTIDAVLGTDNLLEGVISLSADLQRLSETSSTGGQEHELLERELITGM